MKKIIALLLAACLCFGLCACNIGSPVTASQKDAVEKTASLHAAIDYGYSTDSITYESVTDDGTYVTISGVVTFVDNNDAKYLGDYVVILTEGDEKDSYVTKSWELNNLRNEDGTAVDFYQQLYDYVVRNGVYEDGLTYIYSVGDAANVDLMLIAEENELRYWYFVSNKTSSNSFCLSYECTFRKGEKPQFDFLYTKTTAYYNGIAISGESAKTSGTIDVSGGNYVFASENYNDVTKDKVTAAMEDCHQIGLIFIKDILSEAKIGCTVEQLFG